MKAAQPEAVAATRVNPGETLRKARELKNWSQADVATQLNLTLQALHLLETGEFERLPGHTFARGYIRAYAKLLGMDQSRLVIDFDQFTGTDSQGSSVHALGRIEEPARLSHSLLRFASVAVLAVLLVISFFWWQERAPKNLSDSLASAPLEHVEVESADGTTQIHPLDEPEDQAAAQDQASAEAQPGELSADVAGQAAEVASDEAPTITAPATAVATPAAPVAAPVVAAAVPAPVVAVTPSPVVAAAPVASSAPVQAAPGEALVSVRFTENCWTQVTDASGKVLFSALKRKGESLELAGKPPLELRLGFARGAQVSFNGQAVDLAPYTSGETARMKLGL